MSYPPSVSQILKNASDYEDKPRKKSRSEWRKAKELEAARKAGTAAPEVDEDGKDINPHIPHYIKTVPWYIGAERPTLKHQKLQPERQKISWDAKRDPYKNYDVSEYNSVIQEYQKVKEVRKYLREENLSSKDDHSSEDEKNLDKDEEKYVDEVEYMPGTKVDSKQRITVRNLRIREDTAKYLRNLDPSSAYYDPKARSMRDNPYADTDKDEMDFEGENAVRFTGDAQNHASTQRFAWDTQEKGMKVNLLAEPTKLELLKQEFDKKKTEMKSKNLESILKKYGGEEHLNAPPPALLLAQTEDYVEYSRMGNIIQGPELPVIRSRYEEDNFINNHTTIFGSYWKEDQWGYKCCHSLIKNSYCCGKAGKRAIDEAENLSQRISDKKDSDSELKEPSKKKICIGE